MAELTTQSEKNSDIATVVESKIGLLPQYTNYTIFRDNSNATYPTLNYTGGNLQASTQIITKASDNSGNTTQTLNLTSTPITNSQVRDDQRAVGDNCIIATSSSIPQGSLMTATYNQINNTQTYSPALTLPAIQNRRVGTCNDGLYKIKVQAMDTAGNRLTDNLGNPVFSEKVLERDTTSPSAPTASISKNGNRWDGETLSIAIQGEGYANIVANITNELGYKNKLDGVKLGQDGTFALNSFFKLECNNHKYKVSVKLIDRAGNASTEIITNEVTSDECGYCTTVGNGALGLTLNPGSFNLSGYFSHYQNNSGNGEGVEGDNHAGIDMAPYAGFGGNVYAVEDGIIDYSYYQFTDNYSKTWEQAKSFIGENGGWANYVAIKSASGRITLYAHLQNESSPIVSSGQTVTKGQLIGHVGSTGFSTGAHLHFQVQEPNVPVSERKYNLDTLRYSSASTPNTYPVNPFKYLPAINSNLSLDLQTLHCNTSTGNVSNGDGVPEGLPTITETEAKQAIAEYIVVNLDDSVTMISDVERFGNKYSEYNISNLPQKNDSNWIRDNIVSLNYRWGDSMFGQGVGQFKYKNGYNNNSNGYRGIIIPNNYNILWNKANPMQAKKQTAYMVKNGFAERYITSPQSILGIPNNEEGNAGNAGIYNNQAWFQMFSTGYDSTNQPFSASNALYGYFVDSIENATTCNFWGVTIICGGQKTNQFTAKYVVGKVANAYHNQFSGTWGQYGFPITNTFGSLNTTTNTMKPYCKQQFNTGTLDYCDSITEPFKVKINDSKYITARINQIYPVSTTTFDLGLYKLQDQNKKVWVYTHGMNDSINSDTMKNLGLKLSQANPNDIILALDWSQGADDAAGQVANPHLTDEWIRPTATEAYKALLKWGAIKPENINLVGHSMGTMVMTELARQYNIGATTSANNINRLILLDPPKAIYGGNSINGNPEFDVDDNENTNSSLYNSTNGYKEHATKVNIMQAFTGVANIGIANSCGNTGLNMTAKENIAIRTNLQVDGGYNGFVDLAINQCPTHGTVVWDWAQMLVDRKFATDDYSLNQTSTIDKANKSYLNGDQYDSVIISSGLRDENDVLNKNYLGTGKNASAKVQSLITEENNQKVIKGVTGQSNDYWNLDWNNTVTQNRETMTVQGFESGDRVSLFNSDSYYALGTGTIGNKCVYSISSNGSINCRVETSINLIPVNGGVNFTTIEGVNILNSQLLDGQSSVASEVKPSPIRMR
jgi:murein DD-endopeptidase MepM/ murein hydrolase activator NlpD